MAKKRSIPETAETDSSPDSGNDGTEEAGTVDEQESEKPAKPAKRASSKAKGSTATRTAKPAKQAAASPKGTATAKPAKRASRSAKALEESISKKMLAAVTQENSAPAEASVQEATLAVEKKGLAGLTEKIENLEKIEKPGEEFEKKVDIDFWLTKLHTEDIGIYEKDRLMAKNRLVTRNLDFVGGIKEEGRKDGFFGIEKDTWKLDGNDITGKRMCIRWFMAESVEHLGTIEQMVSTSVAASLSVNDDIPIFKMILPDYDFIVDLQKEHPKVPRIDEQYSCVLKDMRKDKKYWIPLMFDQKVIALGSDWNVKADLPGENKKLVANVDEKLLNVGHKYVATFYDENLYHYAQFYRTVLLFGMMLKYREEIKLRIARIRELLQSGKIKLDVSPEEEKLLWNPRYLTNYQSK